MFKEKRKNSEKKTQVNPHDAPPPRPLMPTNFIFYIKQVWIKVLLAILEIINFKYLHTYFEGGKGAHGGERGKNVSPFFFSYTPLISPFYAFQNTFAICCPMKNVAVTIFWKKIVFANLPKTAKFDCPVGAKENGGNIFFYFEIEKVVYTLQTAGGIPIHSVFRKRNTILYSKQWSSVVLVMLIELVPRMVLSGLRVLICILPSNSKSKPKVLVPGSRFLVPVSRFLGPSSPVRLLCAQTCGYINKGCT